MAPRWLNGLWEIINTMDFFFAVLFFSFHRSFKDLIADNQFAPLGLVLLSVLARLYRVLGGAAAAAAAAAASATTGSPSTGDA